MKLLPSCREVQTNLTEYAEGALPVQKRIGIWIHLLLCNVCAGFLRGLKALPGMAKRSLAPPAEPPEAANQALAAVQAALRGPSDASR
jgi:anti-sigma factor ChrR (cupin superfamily)